MGKESRTSMGVNPLFFIGYPSIGIVQFVDCKAYIFETKFFKFEVNKNNASLVPTLLGTGPGTRTPNQLIKSKGTENFQSLAPIAR